MQELQANSAARPVTVLAGTKGFDRVRARHFKAGTTVWQAIERQIPAALHASLEVSIQTLGPDGTVQRTIPAAAWQGTILREGDFLVVELVPQGSGKKLLSSILMLGVIIAAFYLGPAIAAEFGTTTAAWTGGELAVTFTASKTVALVATGLIAGLGSLAVNALVPIKPPKPDTEQTPASLVPFNNSITPGVAVPVPMGDIRFAPPMAAQPITRGNGKERIQTALFCLGLGPLKLDPADIRIGNTPLNKFRGVRFSYVEGWHDDAPVGLYPNDIYADQVSQPTLLYNQEQVVTTQPNTDAAEFEILFQYGLVMRDKKGKRKNRSVSFLVQYRPTGSGTWQALPGSVSHDINNEVRFVGPGANPAGYTARANTGIYTVTDRTAEPRSFSATIDFPSRGQYDLRIVRTTAAPSKEDEDSIVDTAQFWELRSVRREAPVRMKGVALLAVQLPLNDQKPGGVSNLTVRVQRYVTIHENGGWVYPHDTRALGGAMAKHLSSNPAYAFVYAVHGYGTWLDPDLPGAGQVKRPGTPAKRPTPLSAIDTPSILAWRDECDRLDSRVLTARYRYDRLFPRGQRLREVLSEIGQAGRARIAAPGGKLGVAMDREQLDPRGIFTPRNINRLSGTIALAPQPHGVAVTLADRDNDFRQSQVIAYADGYGAVNATDIYPLDAPGVTERWRAWEYGEYYRQAALKRTEIISFNASIDALHNSVGDYVLLKHDVPRPLDAEKADEFPGCRVLAVEEDGQGRAIGVRLDEEVTMAVGEAYCVSIRRAQWADMILNASLTAASGSTKLVTFASPLGNHGIAADDLAIFGLAERVALDVVITDIRPAADLTATITVAALANDIHDIANVALPVFPDYVDTPVDASARSPGAVTNLGLTEAIEVEGGVQQSRLTLTWQAATSGVVAHHFEIYEKATEDHGGVTETQYRFFGSTPALTYTLPKEFSAGDTVELAVLAVSAGGTKLPVKDATHISTTLTVEGDDGLILNDAAGSGNLLWMLDDTKVGVSYTPTIAGGTSINTVATLVAGDIFMVPGDPITFAATVTEDTPGQFEMALRLRFLDSSNQTLLLETGNWILPSGLRIGVSGTWPEGAVAVEPQVLVRNPDGVSATDTVYAASLSLTEGRAVVPWVLPVIPGATRNVFLGAYSGSTTYRYGDTVLYDGSSYVFTSLAPNAGIVPTNAAYWTIMAAAGLPLSVEYGVTETGPWVGAFVAGSHYFMRQRLADGTWGPSIRIVGEDGIDGAHVDYRFKRSASQPGTPTGTNPSGWTDAPPAENGNPLWMTRATFAADGTLSVAWSAPVRLTGEAGDPGNYKDYIYKRAATKPTTPTGNTPIGWTDGQPDPDGNPVWESWGIRNAFDVLVGVWSEPVQVGAPGTERQYSTNASSWHSSVADGDIYFRERAVGASSWGAAVRFRGEDGADGADGNYKDYRYKRSSDEPLTPTGSNPAGWSDGQPVEDGNPVWESWVIRDAQGVPTTTWSRPIAVGRSGLERQYSQDGSNWHSAAQNGDTYFRERLYGAPSWGPTTRFRGEDGANGATGPQGPQGPAGAPGYNTAQVTLFKRSPSLPNVPTSTSTYTFSTATLTGQNNGWTQSVPSGTSPLYVTVAPAFANGATDTIASNEWAAPVVLAQNGSNGTNGTNGTNGSDGVDGSDGSDGLNSATIFLYKRQASGTPAAPSANLTYTFSTGLLSGSLNGWAQTVPTGTAPLFITTASAVSTATTDVIASSEWAAVQLLAQNGADALTISAAPSALTVACNAAGTVKSGELPKTAQITVIAGTTNVTASATYSKVATNCTATVSSGGLVTISALGADSGYVDVTASYGGVSVVIRVTASKALDGAAGVSDVSDAYRPVSTSYATLNTSTVELAIPGGGTVNLSLHFGFQTTGNSSATAKIQYSTNGGSTWVDVGAAVGASAQNFEPGFISFSRSLSGPTGAEVWQFRALGYYGGTQPSVYPNGSVGKFSASWS